MIASEGSIKAACEKLHLTQPTISGQLKTLEDFFGFKLFHRKHRKLELTYQGNFLYKKAERIFVLGDELVSSLSHCESQKHPQSIKIGITPSLSSPLVNQFILSLWKEQGYLIHTLYGEICYLTQLMSQNEIDFILTNNPQSQPNYKMINLGSQKLIGVGNKKFQKYQENFPYSLHHLSYIGFPHQTHLQKEIQYYLELKGIKLHLIGLIDNIDLIKTAIIEGVGFSILPIDAIRTELDQGILFPLGEIQMILSHFWLITSNSASQRVLIKKMINRFLSKDHELKTQIEKTIISA